jgi:hypothetical protein
LGARYKHYHWDAQVHRFLALQAREPAWHHGNVQASIVSKDPLRQTTGHDECRWCRTIL